MKVLNKTKNELLSENAGNARTFPDRARGLMFSRPGDLILASPKEDIPSSSIHMMLMRFPIDVLWLDSGMRVVDLKRKVPPFSLFNTGTWKIYKPKSPARYVIELGKGRIGKTEIGDMVEFA